jgi:hypothetical protein
MRSSVTATALFVGLIAAANATMPAARPPLVLAQVVLAQVVLAQVVLAQAMVPPTGMDDANKPMPMVERMNRRFPQPVRVGDLIGLPMLDDRASTLGFVRQVVRTAQDKTVLVVSYSSWFGWFGRLIAVPIEVVGI